MYNKALVVFSGGQDSATCLVQAIKERGRDNVEALSFIYGQRHVLELEAARLIASELGIKHVILEAGLLRNITDSALLSAGSDINTNGKYPNTLVDGRNMLFLLIAAIYAKNKGVKNIITGVGQSDFSGYPDCRDIFIKSLNVTLNLAMDYEFNIIAPLMWLTKKETWALADNLGVLDFIKERTHSCYQNSPGGCGKCPACLLRNRGYDEYMAQKNTVTQPYQEPLSPRSSN